jgi:hypothetical protein
MADVYLSYGLRDRDLARAIAEILKSHRLTVASSDRDVFTGEELVQKLEEALCTIVIASPSSLKQPHVMHEAITALELGKLVLLATDDLDRKKIPTRLQKVEILSAAAFEDFAKDLGAVRQYPLKAPVSAPAPRERTFHIGGAAPADEAPPAIGGGVFAPQGAEDDGDDRDALYRERMAADDVPITVGGRAPSPLESPLNERLSLDRLASWTAARTAAANADVVTAARPVRPVAPPPPVEPAEPAPVAMAPPPRSTYSEPSASIPDAAAPRKRKALRDMLPSKSGGSTSLIDYALPAAFILVSGYALVATSLGRDILDKISSLLGWKHEAFSFLGLLSSQKSPATPPADTVDCSVFAPPAAPAGTTVMVQVFLHVPAHAERAAFMASMMDQSAVLKGVKTLEIAVPRGAEVTVSLSGVDLEIDEPQQTVVWRGEPTFCQFVVRLPDGCDGKSFHPVVRIAVAGGLVGRIAFRLAADPAVATPQSSPQGESARRYAHAFLSYASADRREVLKRAQVLEAAGVSFFQDSLKLDPGARWQKEIYRNIDKCDLFLLFWSRAAKSSEWVVKEAEYALRRQVRNGSLPDIVPVILETPPPLPPEGLSEIHFDDRVHHLISIN